MSAPSVYAAINAVSADLATGGIAKTHTNQADDYKYRSIDDVLDRLAPLLAKHRLCVLPRVKSRTVSERADEQGRLILQVTIRVAFTLTSVDDGTSHKVEAYGEALDAGDKATAKAMSAAYKSAIIQTFCIPCGSEDADRLSHRLAAKSHDAEPLQGWTQWCLDVEDIVALCESTEAIRSVQERYRDLLKALSREQPHLYRQLGEAFASRSEVLQQRVSQGKRGRAAKVSSSPKKQSASDLAPKAEVQHA